MRFLDGVVFSSSHGFFHPERGLLSNPSGWHGIFGGQADHSKDDGTTLAAIRKMITESDDPDGDG